MVRKPGASESEGSNRSDGIPVNPTVLVWARESIGRTVEEVASRLKESEDNVMEWEAGNKQPTIGQLRTLAVFYKRPLAALLLPAPPGEISLPHDFRTLPRGNEIPLSPRTRLVMRQARRLQSIATELKGRYDSDLATRIGTAKLSDDPEIVASRVRAVLGISLQEQVSRKKDTEAMEMWKKSIENLEILVFQMSMPIDEVRAFSFTDGGLPAIVINTKDALRARIFSMLHELGHILLNEGGICDTITTNGDESPNKSRSIEYFCNFFAGAILIPQESLLSHHSVEGKTSSYEWPDRTLGAIANNFKVSKEVVLRRLLIAGLTNREFYQRKHHEWLLREKTKVTTKRVKRDIPRESIQRNGMPLTTMVLDSYRKERITASDVVDYLGIRVKHIPGIERLLEA